MSFDLPILEAQLRPSLDTLRHHVHNLQSELEHSGKAHEDPLQIMLRMLDRINLMLLDPRKYHEDMWKGHYPYTDYRLQPTMAKAEFVHGCRAWLVSVINYSYAMIEFPDLFNLSLSDEQKETVNEIRRISEDPFNYVASLVE